MKALVTELWYRLHPILFPRQDALIDTQLKALETCHRANGMLRSEFEYQESEAKKWRDAWENRQKQFDHVLSLHRLDHVIGDLAEGHTQVAWMAPPDVSWLHRPDGNELVVEDRVMVRRVRLGVDIRFSVTERVPARLLAQKARIMLAGTDVDGLTREMEKAIACNA